MHPMISAYNAHRASLGLGAGAPEVIFRRAFASEAERLELLDWALRMRPHLKGNGDGRQFRQTDTLPHLPALYTEVRLRLEQTLGLQGFEREPMFGWYLSIIDEGGAVHSHLDPTRPGFRHLRCNLFLQLPQAGGLPIIEGRARPVAPGDLLAFFPSERRHRSESVDGGAARVILSFGYLAPDSYDLPSEAVRRPTSARPARQVRAAAF